MGLETVNVIEDLDPNWPLGTDPVSQGDDHIRNIKKAVQGSFPNLGENAVTKTAEEINAAGSPVASLIIYAGNSAPSGYLICDGLEISRTTYEALYAVIGDTYGEGDGSTTFNLPNMAGRVPAGITESNPLATQAGKNTWNADDLPRHTHTMANGGAHVHSLKTSSFDNPSGSNDVVDKEQDHGSEQQVLTQTDGAHQHIINNTGLSTSADNRQRTLYLNYLIKT